MSLSREEWVKLARVCRDDSAPCKCGHQSNTHQDEWGCKLCDDCHEYQPPARQESRR